MTEDRFNKRKLGKAEKSYIGFHLIKWISILGVGAFVSYVTLL